METFRRPPIEQEQPAKEAFPVEITFDGIIPKEKELTWLLPVRTAYDQATSLVDRHRQRRRSDMPLDSFVSDPAVRFLISNAHDVANKLLDPSVEYRGNKPGSIELNQADEVITDLVMKHIERALRERYESLPDGHENLYQ
jgi:hypothetical protein